MQATLHSDDLKGHLFIVSKLRGEQGDVICEGNGSRRKMAGEEGI